MDNIVSIKRKAQKLVQQGSYDEAIDQYTQVVDSGQMDPYDYVVLGDLLLRNSRKDDAIQRYQEAMESYASGGLNRNSIALAKRIKRLAPERLDIQRRLGDLYSAEGLKSEAALHYLEFLERARETEDFPEAAESICSQLLEFELPSFELVPRIVSIAQEVDRASSLAVGVYRQALRADDAGQERVRDTLMELAESLNPKVKEIATQSSAGIIDPGALSLESGPGAPETAPTLATSTDAAYDPGAIDFSSSSDEDASESVSFDDDPSAVDLEAVDLEPETTETAAGAEDQGVVDLSDMEDEPGLIDLSELETEETDTDSTLLKLEDGVSAGLEETDVEPAEDGAALRGRAERSLAKGDSIAAQRELMRAAAAYLGEDELHEAEELYHRVVQLDPNHLEALRGLVEIAHRQEITDKIARFGCELGDGLIARERYDDARVEFERVLAIDPEHPKALSRVGRLNNMTVGEPDLPAEEPARGATVQIRDDAEGRPTQTAQELAAILDEFRNAVVDSIPTDDPQAHYDMGMAYAEMDLIDEAIVEFEAAAQNEDMRIAALEMLADCYLRRARSGEALNILEEVLAYAEDDTAQSRIHFAIGKTREAMGLLAEAEESYFQALELNQDFLEAAERLNAMEQRRAEGA